MTDTDITIQIVAPWWYAGTLAVIAAILNDANVEVGLLEQKEIEKLLNRMLDACHPSNMKDLSKLLDTYARMFNDAAEPIPPTE